MKNNIDIFSPLHKNHQAIDEGWWFAFLLIGGLGIIFSVMFMALTGSAAALGLLTAAPFIALQTGLATHELKNLTQAQKDVWKIYDSLSLESRAQIPLTIEAVQGFEKHEARDIEYQLSRLKYDENCREIEARRLDPTRELLTKSIKDARLDVQSHTAEIKRVVNEA